MPQMKPIMWLILMIFVIFLLFIIFSSSYFSFTYKKEIFMGESKMSSSKFLW